MTGFDRAQAAYDSETPAYLDDDGRCPDCGAPERVKGLYEGGGVECSAKCGWWFCW